MTHMPSVIETSTTSPSPATVPAPGEDNLEVQQAIKTTSQTSDTDTTARRSKSKFVNFPINAFVLMSI
jgi:hypothetical protein